MKRFLGILLSIALMLVLVSGMSLTAFADGGTTDTESVPAYTVEFTFGGKQYVMPGDSTVALKEILDCIGITGEVSDVKVSESTLFSGSNDSGEWVVTAHRAFSTDEWMRVIIDSRVYEIVVTDTKYTTSQTVTTDGNDWDWFGEGKYFVCDNSQTYTINGSITALAPSDGSGTDHGSNNWTATIDASGKLTHKIGGAQYTATLSGNNNTWHLYWNEYAPGYYGSGAAMWEQTYTAPPTVDPTVTAPTLAESRDYNGSPLQLITAETTSNSSGTRYYGLGTSSSSVPSTWYTSITDSNLKKTDQGTYFVWYKQDAATGYNAKAATYVGSVTINQKEVGLTWTNTNLTYNGQSQTPTATATGIISGDTCTVNITGGQTNYSASAYTATANSLSNSNYKLPSSKTTTFTIGQREVTLSWPANTTYPYNGKEQTPVATAGNLVSGDTCIVTVTGGETNVGSNYTATASGLSNNNYKLPGSNKTCTFSISQAELTVTANNHTITYGDAPANSGVGYSGFQNGETAAVLGGTLTYSYNYEQYGNVGNSYTITPGGLTSSNYDIQFANGTLTVNPKSVTPSLTGAVSKVYDGGTSVAGAKTNTLSIALDGVVNSDDVSATFSSAAYDSPNYGTAVSVTASGIALSGTKAGNYALSAPTASANVGAITKRPVTITAKPQTVELNSKTTANGLVLDGTTATTASAKLDIAVTGEGFVDPAHTLTSVTLAASDTSAPTTTGTVTPRSAAIKEHGTDDVTSNYNITYAPGILTVTKGVPVVNEAPSAADITYGDTLNDSTISGSMKDKYTGAAVKGQFSWKLPESTPAVADSGATDYDVTFTPDDSTNYAPYTCKLKVAVNPRVAELEWTDTELTYNGQAQKPTATVTNLVSGDKVFVTVSGEKTDASTTPYTAKASGLTGDQANNYTLTGTTNTTQDFTIGPKPITGATLELKLPANLVYDGSQKTVTVASVTLTDGTVLGVTDYEVSGDVSGTDAGTYTVTVTGKSPYKGTATQTWTISMYQPTIQTKPTAKAITYGQALSDSALTGGVVKFENSDVEGTFTWKTPATKPVVADSDKTAYKVVFTPKDTINFSTAECEVTLTVNPADAVAATVKADNRTYDASEKALVSVDKSTLVGGDMWYALGKDTTTAPTDGWSISIPTATNADTYYVWYKAKGDENHLDSDPKCVSVVIKKESVKPEVPTDKLVYNGKDQPLVEAGKAEGGTLLYAIGADGKTAPTKGWSETVPTGKNAGTYYVWYKVQGDKNHKDTDPVALEVEIAKKPLVVTAEDKAKTYGDADPELTWTQEGLVEGDALAVTLKRAEGENVGGYTITVDKYEASDNYDQGFNEAVLTITAREATVTALDQTITEGESINTDPSMAKLSGQAKGDTLRAITLTATAANAANATGTIIASRAIILNAAGADMTDNYSITYTSGKLTVNQKPVTPDVALLARMTVAGSSKTALRVKWQKVKGAEGYDVYFARCGKDYSRKAKASVSSCSVRFTKLKKRTEYKAYVKAWKKVKGKKIYIGKASPEVHAITGGYDAKNCNAKSVKLNKASLSLSVGKSKTLKATVKGVKSGKKVLEHVRKVRYYSSNLNVATVNRNGKVKAVGKGSCTIWAIANNGVRTSVKVTVK